MEPHHRVRACLHPDDGQPESRDVDSDCVPLEQTSPRHWLSVLRRLRAWQAAQAAGADRDWLAPRRPDATGDRGRSRFDARADPGP